LEEQIPSANPGCGLPLARENNLERFQKIFEEICALKVGAGRGSNHDLAIGDFEFPCIAVSLEKNRIRV